jgi:phosphatidylglycerol:prolipoprotein diacylglycerol transferase
VLALLGAIGWPVLDRFRFGDFAVSPHGLGIAVGFMIGAVFFQRHAAERGIREDHASQIVFWSLIGSIVGARFFYVLAHLSDFENPVEWLKIWEGGISLLGGIAGATIINAIRIRRQGYRFFQVADALAAPLALGIAIGRIGDLIVGDHLGKPTSWLLAWTYEGGTLSPPFSCANEVCTANLQEDFVESITREGARLLEAGVEVASGTGVHQTALYDMLLAWPLFALIWFLAKKDRRAGVLTLTFGLVYGCTRLLEDSLRIDKRFGPFTGSQWTALAVAIVSAALLLSWAMSERETAPAATAGPDPGG